MEGIKLLRIAMLILVGMAASSAYAKGFDVTYEARVGDLNGDSLTDIYLKPKPKITTIPVDDLIIPVPLPTDVSPFVLRRTSSQTFELVSTLTSSERSAVGQWAASSIIVAMIDANMDGFTDVVLRDIPGADDQVVVAAAAIRQPPVAVKAMDAYRNQFLEDVAYWSQDPAFTALYTEVNWFTLWDLIINNVQVGGFPISGDPYDPEQAPDVCWYTACDYDPFWGWVVALEITYPVLVYQHPIHTAEAFYLTQAIDPTLENPVIVAQTPAGQYLEDLIEGLLGTTGGVMNNALTQGGGRDPEAEVPPEDVPRSRAIEYLAMILDLFEAAITYPNWRYLTPGEKAELAAFNGLNIKNINIVRVHAFGFLGMDDYVMAPNGHIYIGRNAGTTSSMPWSNDYAPLLNPFSVGIKQRGIFAHELTHVFQNRNWDCRISNGCMIVEKLTAMNDYCYSPLIAGKKFRDYGLEEEAEMVSDRYRMRRGSMADDSCNQPAQGGPSLSQLEQLIPF